MRYRPADGKGWGLNGELLGDWHSFRERGDGSCCYSDGRCDWYTGDPETAWTFTDLAMLEDLRKQTESFPQAALPSAVSHPSLFAAAGSTATGGLSAAASTKKRPAPPPSDDEDAVPAMSRKERFKQRVLNRVKDEESSRDKQRTGKLARVASGNGGTADVPLNVELPKPGVPTQQEEMSAATFLAAVKTRLTEWGKLDQYHQFVVALSGSVDAKAAVRILRGHDDLLLVFRNKFAPRSDLVKIKAELQEDDEQNAPRPPASAPRVGVKQEVGAWSNRKGTPPTPAAGKQGSTGKPHAPAGPPPRKVKEELGRNQAPVKTETGVVKGENVPHPPKFDPHSRRSTVTIGDDSDDEIPDEAKLAAASRKGRECCIAELAKTIFRKERAAHQGARQRLATVRYATKRSARPRFPRELYIMRGAPGVGKSDYAMQRIHETAGLESGEELAARLTHVCAVDDFFERFTADGVDYEFHASKLEANHLRNEARLRLAMEVGIHPLFVDCPNAKLWEMKPYVELADRLGYVVTIVEPTDINSRGTDIEYLVSACDTASRRATGRVVPRGAVKPILESFEQLPTDQDPLDAIRAANRPAAALRLIEAVPMPPEPPAGSDGGVRPSAPGTKGKDAPRPSASSAGSQSKPPSAPTSRPNGGPAWVQVKTENTHAKGGARW